MGKVVSLRGTSGSGKTHLAREVMAKYKLRFAIHIANRKQPYYYEFRKTPKGKPLYVLGHYETACGGCDTIKTADEVFALVDKLRKEGDVLFEGLLLSTEVNRTVAAGDIHNVFFDVPVVQCLSQINARRRAKDPSKEDVDPTNTTSKHRGVARAHQRLLTVKEKVFKGDYNACRDYVFKVLGL